MLQQNDRARKLYERHGLQILRGLVILQASSTSPEHENNALPHPSSSIHERYDWETWQQRSREQQAPEGILPAFESSDAFLNREPERYHALYRRDAKGKIIAWCVYDHSQATLMQLGYSDAAGLRQLISQLVDEHKTLRTANLDESASELLDLLRALGFTERARQYEMGMSYE